MVSIVVSWFQRYLPLAFGLLFIGGLLGYRVLRFSRIYGFSPLHIPHAGDQSAPAFLSRLLVVCFGVVLALGVLAALWPEGLETLDLLYSPPQPVVLRSGVVLAALATWLVWRGQNDMAASWRIGIAPGERTELVTGGLFQFCRNPIYLGLKGALAAFCCFLPGYLSGGLLLLGTLLLQVQAQLEEAYLLEQHGKAYAAYCARVGRFLPFSGRYAAPAAPPEKDRHEKSD